MRPSNPHASAATRAVLATVGLYGGYAALSRVPALSEFSKLLLLCGFYFLPSLLLASDPEKQRRYGVGPDGPLPPWSAAAGRTSLFVVAIVFPVFIVGFFWFYAQVCRGDLSLLAPVAWLEAQTPAAGALERFLGQLCRTHAGTFWPSALVFPAAWTEYGGGGFLLVCATTLFANALPEEVFHRGYLMSTLEDLWPAKRRLFGVPFGVAAVVSSLLFAAGHLVSMAEAARLATFFPGLLFAYLWRRTGSLWAPALVHTAANLTMDLLLATTFPR